MGRHNKKLRPFPIDVTDEERALVAPYLTLMREDAPQREHSLRDIFNALRWMARSGDGVALIGPSLMRVGAV